MFLHMSARSVTTVVGQAAGRGQARPRLEGPPGRRRQLFLRICAAGGDRHRPTHAVVGVSVPAVAGENNTKLNK